MTASLLQLVAVGNEDYLICGNPQITFWKNVYLKHTNFSFERVEILPKTPSKYNYDSFTEIIFDINTDYGDMLDNIFFYIELPDIYSKYPYKFHWIDNIGNFIIKNAYLIINDEILENIDSNLIHIIDVNNENNKNMNIRDNLVNARMTSDKYIFSSDNKFVKEESMCSINKINNNFNYLPSISSKKLYIKIPFFFSKDSIKLPINALSNTKVKIKIDLRPLRELFYIGKPVSIITKKNSYETFDIDNESTYNKFEYFRYYAPRELPEFNFENMIKDSSYFNNINIGLISYVYFLDKVENKFFTENKQSLLINTFKIYNYITKDINPALVLEDSSLVKEILLVPQRNDVELRNQWNYYGINDYNMNKFNLKFSSNYFLKISYDQYHSDINYINTLNLNNKKIIEDVTSKEHFKIIINYTNNSGNHICLCYDETRPDKYQYYLERTESYVDDIISPLYYYGAFLNDRGYSIIKIDGNTFHTKLYNVKKNSTSSTSLKNLPKIYSDYNNLYIYFDELISTPSILKEPIYVKQDDCIKPNDIYQILNTWNMRFHKDIPFIDDNNSKYFYPDTIVKELDLKVKGNSIINPLKNFNIYNSHKFSHYSNMTNINNIVRYSFANKPTEYQPSGHIDLEKIDKLFIYLKNKDIKKLDSSIDPNIRFYVYLSTINKLIINDNKVKLFISN